jgi:hypothetical protein
MFDANISEKQISVVEKTLQTSTFKASNSISFLSHA